jgi:transcriptional regulator with XRE-family HTH domain
MSQLFEKALRSVTPEVKQFVDNTMSIVDQIHSVLKRKGVTQRQFAEMLGKKESEISKWLSVTHNLTVLSISKIEAVLDEKIMTTPKLSRSNKSKNLVSGRRNTHQTRKKMGKVKSN